jgi:hypothetical protein
MSDYLIAIPSEELKLLQNKGYLKDIEKFGGGDISLSEFLRKKVPGMMYDENCQIIQEVKCIETFPVDDKVKIICDFIQPGKETKKFAVAVDKKVFDTFDDKFDFLLRQLKYDLEMSLKED